MKVIASRKTHHIFGLAAIVSLHAVSSSGETQTPIFQRDIVLPGSPDQGKKSKKSDVLGTLQIFSLEEPADAVYRFGKLYGLHDWQRRQILDNICESPSLNCRRKDALLWSAPVSIGKSDDTEENIVEFRLLEGVEAADAVDLFVEEHGLSEEYRKLILNAACAAVECTRTEPSEYLSEDDIL